MVRGGKEKTVNVIIGELPERGEGEDASQSSGSPHSRIGLQVAPLEPETAERLGVSGGVRVVESTGAAADAGIRAGDVITRLDNQEVSDPDAFRSIVEGLAGGRSVPVLINRGQVPTFLALRIPE